MIEKYDIRATFSGIELISVSKGQWKEKCLISLLLLSLVCRPASSAANSSLLGVSSRRKAKSFEKHTCTSTPQ